MPHLVSAKPAPSDPEGTGFPSPDPLAAALDLVRAWAERPLAILLSGSHAAGEAVRAAVGGRAFVLSDVDVYVVMPDDAACAAARARMRAGRARAADQLAALGMVAPLEVAFLSPRDLGALPARPGTLALRARGRVIEGDAAWLARVPAWTGRDVSDEEIGLLLENRAFELLWARPRLGAPRELVRLEARHAVLKTALELAGVDELLAGAWAPSAAERVRHARERGGQEGRPALDEPWDAALAWRAGDVRELAPAAAAEEWWRVAEAWRALWWRWSERAPGRAGSSPFSRARRAARRAPLRRRLREALTFAPRAARGPSLPARLRHAAAGTPVHRVNACGVVLLLAAPAPGAGDALAPEVARALAPLGVLRRADLATHARAAAAAVRAWDAWCLDGTRVREDA